MRLLEIILGIPAHEDFPLSPLDNLRLGSP